MSITKNIISQLLNYVMNNEVVCQFCGELMDVFYDNEKENKAALLSYLSRAKRIEVYDKHNDFLKEHWSELVDWSTVDDVLFLLQNVSIVTNYNIVA